MLELIYGNKLGAMTEEVWGELESESEFCKDVAEAQGMFQEDAGRDEGEDEVTR